MARGLKMFVRLFRIKASESLDKNFATAIYKEEKWRKGEKKSPLQLRSTQECLNYKKSSQRVSSLRETRCFAKCFRHYSALRKKTRRKTFRRNYIQVR